MTLHSRSFLRAARLLWLRMGAARIYVVVAAAALLILAAIGLKHLFSGAADERPPALPSAGTREQAQPPSPSPTPTPKPLPTTAAADQEIARQPLLAITNLDSQRRRLRDGSTLVSARIGVASVAAAKKGEVEIRVFFFDRTRSGELRPTDAEVTYEWLTPARDWSDPSPKFLEATYLRPRRPRQPRERLRYGGFVVRVYSNGQLQDERGEPRQILAALRRSAVSATPTDNDATLDVPPTTASSMSDDDEDLNEPVLEDSTPTPPPERKSEPAPRDQPPTPAPASNTATSTAPFGKPVPGKPGFIHSPHNEKFILDVRGVPPGSEIMDPNTSKLLRVP